MLSEGVHNVLIEINTLREEHKDIIRRMESLGYTWSKEEARAAIRTEGPFSGTGNHIFRK